MEHSNKLNPGKNPENSPVNTDSSILHTVLLGLKKLDKSDLQLFLKNVLNVISDTLNTERVSIWFFNEERTGIYCEYLYSKNSGGFISETPLSLTDFPRYFNAIENNLYIDASDSKNDPRTAELADKYLIPKNIFSMLDVPVHFRGVTAGIICNEELNLPRNWEREEVDFIAAVSVLITIALEIDSLRKKEKDYAESRRFLSTLISNLPGYVYRVVKDNENWSIQYISDGVYDLTGYKPEELISNRVLYYSMMINEEDRKNAKEIISKALEVKKPYQINYRIITADKKHKWVWEQGQGVYSTGGELIATEGFITDITDKKLYEEEIISKNEELSALYNFGKSLGKLAEPVEIADTIGTILQKLLKTDNIFIALVNENTKIITYPFNSGKNPGNNNESDIFTGSLSEYVIRTAKPLIILSEMEQQLTANNIIGKTDCKAIVSVPLIAGNKVVGVVTLQDFNRENAFSAMQIELLKTVASQAAIALENSYLYTEVTNSLGEKEILLKEVHHRVKNNLQVMSSLIKLQSRYLKDEYLLDIMKETGNRFQSMSIVHSKLYNSGNYDNIDFGDYIKNLTDNFHNSYGFKLKNIKFITDVQNVVLNIDTAIPCGLIINELVSNSIKYAFPENRSGEILISLKQEGGNSYKLTIKDDGIGVSDTELMKHSDTLGIQLVNLLTRQLNGTLEISSQINNGIEFIIKFEEALYKARK